MAVTVITKKRGRPLVTGLVGVSMMSCDRRMGKGKKEKQGKRGGGGSKKKKVGEEAEEEGGGQSAAGEEQHQ